MIVIVILIITVVLVITVLISIILVLIPGRADASADVAAGQVLGGGARLGPRRNN